MSIATQKQMIRRQMRDHRQALSKQQLISSAEALTERLSELVGDQDFPLAMYLSFDNELPTHHFIERCWQQDRAIFLPLIQGKLKPLLFRQYDSETILTDNCYGIGEPDRGTLVGGSELAVICLPLTAFDRAGGRLGMGGGYYDVTLNQLPSDNNAVRPKLIGLGYEFQEVSECPRESHDQPLDWIVTPAEIIKLTS